MIDMWVCNSVPLCWTEKWKHTWMKHSVWALLRWAIWRTSDLQIVSRALVRWHALFDLHVWGGNSCLFMSFYVSVLCLIETYIYTFIYSFIYLFYVSWRLYIYILYNIYLFIFLLIYSTTTWPHFLFHGLAGRWRFKSSRSTPGAGTDDWGWFIVVATLGYSGTIVSLTIVIYSNYRSTISTCRRLTSVWIFVLCALLFLGFCENSKSYLSSTETAWPFCSSLGFRKNPEDATERRQDRKPAETVAKLNWLQPAARWV